MSAHPRLKIELSSRLQQLRRDKGLTQAELARLCDLPQPVVSLYENADSNRMPTLLGLIKIANALNVSCDYLLARTNDKRGAQSLFSEDEVLNQLSRKDKQILLHVAKGLFAAAQEKQEVLKASRSQKKVPMAAPATQNTLEEFEAESV